MKITVEHVELSLQDDRHMYVMTVHSIVDGVEERRIHFMEHDIFESRAAEYDIDPEAPGGWDDLFDMVITGSYIHGSADQQLVDPNFLLNAPTVAHARKTELAKIRKARGNGTLRGATGHAETRGLSMTARGIDNSGDEDPLEFVKRTAPMSREHIRVKQEYTRRRRNVIRTRNAGRHPLELSDVSDADAQVRRDMALNRVPPRETPHQLAARLLGDPVEAPVDSDTGETIQSHLPPREGPPSKDLPGMGWDVLKPADPVE